MVATNGPLGRLRSRLPNVRIEKFILRSAIRLHVLDRRG